MIHKKKFNRKVVTLTFFMRTSSIMQILHLQQNDGIDRSNLWKLKLSFISNGRGSFQPLVLNLIGRVRNYKAKIHRIVWPWQRTRASNKASWIQQSIVTKIKIRMRSKWYNRKTKMRKIQDCKNKSLVSISISACISYLSHISNIFYFVITWSKDKGTSLLVHRKVHQQHWTSEKVNEK